MTLKRFLIACFFSGLAGGAVRFLGGLVLGHETGFSIYFAGSVGGSVLYAVLFDHGWYPPTE